MAKMIRISDQNYKELAELAKSIGKSETETLELAVFEFYKSRQERRAFLAEWASKEDNDAFADLQDS